MGCQQDQTQSWSPGVQLHVRSRAHGAAATLQSGRDGCLHHDTTLGHGNDPSGPQFPLLWNEENTLFLKGTLLPSSECSQHAVSPVQTGVNIFIRNSVFIRNYSLSVLFTYLGVGSGGAGHRRASQTPGQVEGGQAFGRGRIDWTALKSCHVAAGSAHWMGTPETDVGPLNSPVRQPPSLEVIIRGSFPPFPETKQKELHYAQLCDGNARWENLGSERPGTFPAVTELAGRGGRGSSPSQPLNQPSLGTRGQPLPQPGSSSAPCPWCKILA